ncbi:MAG TPA: MBL fold metallo-hydrolase [Kofleriaceae bacterium]|nr:MBL fold metallo-hydrolase [Kofleriaceae bacterium]
MSVESIYAEVRRLTGGDVAIAAPELTEAAPGIASVALRTPTLPPAAHTACYLVGDGEMVAVDPGSPFPDQQAALVDAVRARGQLVAVLLTHHHGDHVGGAAALAEATGAPIWAHEATAAELPGLAIARLLRDGEVIAIGGRALRVLHTPGHAVGHLVFRDEASAAMIAGDMVAGLGTILIDPDGGHMATYLASLARMIAEGAGALLPSHGPVIADGPAKLREYIAHRLMRERRVRDALGSSPKSAADLCAVAYADTPSFLWPLAQRSLLAHLVKLAEDGVAVDDGSGWRLL